MRHALALILFAFATSAIAQENCNTCEKFNDGSWTFAFQTFAPQLGPQAAAVTLHNPASNNNNVTIKILQDNQTNGVPCGIGTAFSTCNGGSMFEVTNPSSCDYVYCFNGTMQYTLRPGDSAEEVFGATGAHDRIVISYANAGPGDLTLPPQAEIVFFDTLTNAQPTAIDFTVLVRDACR